MAEKEYIERETVNDLIKAECSPKVAAYLIDAVATVPAADVVEARHGRWEAVMLDHERMGCRPTAYYCSECNQITWFRTFYCPNCGADMMEES